MKPHLLYLITEDWFFCSHFIERARAACVAGYRVTVVTRVSGHGDVIRQAGMNLIHLEIERRGMNPWRAWCTIRELIRIFSEQRPDIVHNIALKPILFGTLAARLTKLPKIINAPVGMGYVFTSRDTKAWLLRPFLRLAFSYLLNPPNSRVVFENRDDLQHLVQTGHVRRDAAILIRGAGVNLEQFTQRPEPTGDLVVVLVARMLWDKGVGEFVEAARQLRASGITARFRLIGAPDSGNPASIDDSTLKTWQDEGCIEWLGHREDISVLLGACHIACLPSYREGLPKSLLEALACGLPVVATDVPGCREVVVDGENGFLVPPRDAGSLATALKKLIENAALRARMGARGRRFAETDFSSAKITSGTLALYQSLVSMHDFAE